MEQNLATIDDRPMTRIEALQSDIELIQTMMKSIMVTGQHYGVIPGCGDKPALLKCGAEKLCSAFRLSANYDIEKINLENGHREYAIKTTLKHIPSGNVIGQGVGLCSTMETKYRYRKAEIVCPNCNNKSIIKGKAEFGGGWICWNKKNGCGSTFSDDDERITNQPRGRVENEDLADIYNTVLKMAKKRSLVDAVLTCTAASDLFTQDIEEINNYTESNHDSKTQPPKSKSNAKSNGNSDPNAIWGTINKEIESLQTGITSKEIKGVREILVNHQAVNGESLNDYVSRIGLTKVCQTAIDAYFAMEKK